MKSNINNTRRDQNLKKYYLTFVHFFLMAWIQLIKIVKWYAREMRVDKPASVGA